MAGRFIDGVLCSCRAIKDESQTFACDVCGDVACDDCYTKCSRCRNNACRLCTGEINSDICYDCELTDNMLSLRAEADRKESLDDVFILVGGNAYHVSKENKMAKVLLDGTEPILREHERIRYLDIKGLGLLNYSHRSVRGRGFGKGVEYYLYFNPLHETLPFGID